MSVLILPCADKKLDLSRSQIMGILNVTPDSFSDGGRFNQLDQALGHARQMVAEGASIIDIGGESTRPGATPVGEQEELDRVLPVLERVRAELDVVISLDTSNPRLMSEGAKLGAGMINDVRALQREGALEAVAATDMAVCLMHMQGATPATMQNAPEYDSVIDEVSGFLQQRIRACEASGIGRERITLDPGFGFGKTLVHNLELLNRMAELQGLGLPLLVGTSRKSMVGQALNREVDQRLYGSLATVALAVERGGRIIRVHDVAATHDVVRMTEAVLAEQGEHNG